MAGQIVLNNRFQLREHPDKSPVADPSFWKTHAWIFPGDELVLCNTLNLPTDAGASGMSTIKLQSVKTSIIAEKQGVFSDIFSSIFEAERSFDLDSFSLTFNNANAPVIPWGTDGYAPNINFQQDRNWKLPSGAFKRQINYFTTYTPSVAGVQPTSLKFYPTGSDSTIAVGHAGGPNAVGLVNWTTDLNTTMALLATSINTNTNHGTPYGVFTSFDNSAGYTASWDSINQIFTLNPPPNVGASINGIDYGMFGPGGGLSFYSGIFVYPWAGGVNPVSANWAYNFYFPTLFRWEYWLQLLAADPDFYNATIPSVASPEGQNNFWENYSLPPGWQIKSHIELNLIVNGVAQTLVNEYSLSNETTEIQTYNSNPDYTSKSIKTGPVGGPYSNTPAAIFGYQDTAIQAYFTKVANWVSGEQANLVGFMWIEPFEGAGESVRVVASSIFPVPASSWFIDMYEQIYTNAGMGLEDNMGNPITTNASGYGVLVTFDISNNKNIILLSQISYAKLNAAFPGVTQFTIYARLYNGTTIVASSTTTLYTPSITGSQYVAKAATGQSYVIAGIPAGYTLQSVIVPDSAWIRTSTGSISGGSQTIDFTVGNNSGTILFNYENGGNVLTTTIDVYVGATKMGEEIQQVLNLVRNNPVAPTNIGLTGSQDCCFQLPVFADGTGNPLNNDMSDFYYYGDNGISAISMILQKNVNGVWTDQYTFAGNTYGNFFAFGKAPDFSGTNFTDDYGKKYTGVNLQWALVLANFGTGQYRMAVTYTTILSTTYTLYSQSNYCLYIFNSIVADQTVRIEFMNKGLRGAGIEDNQTLIDYYTGWNSQIRLPGIFWTKDPKYTQEFYQYGDLNFNAKMPAIIEQSPKFRLDIRPIPGWVDLYVGNNVLLADQIFITDYNLANRHTFIKTPVINDAGITVHDDNFMNSNAWAEVNFEYGYNNIRRRNE